MRGLRSWLIPLAAAIGLAAIGIGASWLLERSLATQVHNQLITILEADVSAIRLWARSQVSAAEREAGQPDVRRSVAELVQLAAHLDPDSLFTSEPAQRLRLQLEPALWRQTWSDFLLVDREGVVLLASSPPTLEHERLVALAPLDRVLSGEALLTKPFPSPLAADAPRAAPRSGGAGAPSRPDGAGAPQGPAGVGSRPTMLVATPVRDERGQVLAALAFRAAPETDFTSLLTVARMGESGETYAFDESGVMVSSSRFDDDLRAVDLLPPDPGTTAALNVEVRNPGGNLLEGFLPPLSRRDQPLTRMAAAATRGEDGVDIEGYRDYRGVPVVGAWSWLPEMGIGIATEVDVDEAYATLYALRRGLWGLFGLLLAGAVGVFYYTRVVEKLQDSVDRARRLGQYRLEEKIGEGGMGKVYRARHALLRRPTAIKLIGADGQRADLLARFEREVQFTSRLTHPNTIAIYDYGRTADGVFYYAMEFLDGIDLDRLVGLDGPQPEARVIHILRQACGSLAEAHDEGLVHRDIKPSNFMLCQRGGVFDFLKVLDFGLVREVEQPDDAALTEVNSLVGTPMYLAPECIGSADAADARSDLYQLGAVAYYLLVGAPVFEGNAVEVCSHHLHTTPTPPSERLGRPVDPRLEGLILGCLEKSKEARPSSAAAVRVALESCAAATAWTQEDARSWWRSERGARAGRAAAVAPTPADDEAAPRVVVDVAGRVSASEDVTETEA